MVGDHADTRIVELHPLTLALNDRVIVAKLQTLTFVYDDAFEVVNFGAALTILDAQLLGKRYPKIKFLLHKRLRINPEALQMDEKHLGIVAHHDLFRGNLASQTRFTHQFIVLIEKLLE